MIIPCILIGFIPRGNMKTVQLLTVKRNDTTVIDKYSQIQCIENIPFGGFELKTVTQVHG